MKKLTSVGLHVLVAAARRLLLSDEALCAGETPVDQHNSARPIALHQADTGEFLIKAKRPGVPFFTACGNPEHAGCKADIRRRRCHVSLARRVTAAQGLAMKLDLCIAQFVHLDVSLGEKQIDVLGRADVACLMCIHPVVPSCRWLTVMTIASLLIKYCALEHLWSEHIHEMLFGQDDRR